MGKLAGLTSGPALAAGGVATVVLGVGLYATGVIGPRKPAPDKPEPAALIQQESASHEAVQQEAATGGDPSAEAKPETEVETEAEGVAPEDESKTIIAEPVPESAQDAEQVIAAPSIDTFRLDPDGTMLLAGQAHPGWTTSVVLDGAELDKVTPDGAGQFVAFLSIEISDQPRILSLITRNPIGGEDVASFDEIIIAPMATVTREPDLVAKAEPEISDGSAAEGIEITDTSEMGEPSGDAQDIQTAAVSGASSEAEPALSSEPETNKADAIEPPAEPENVEPESLALVDAEPEGALSAVTADTTVIEPETQQTTGAEAEAVDPSQSSSEKPTQTVLLANEEGVQVIQSATSAAAAPEVMSNVALDAITYSEQGEVQLSGRAQGTGFVRVYLDNAPITTSRIAEDGNWRTDLPEVDTGVYTLRIDETDAEGNVTSRVETPFKREDEALISANSDAIAQQRITAVTVQPGSTLWAISRERYGEGTLYVRVFEANRDRIRDPDLIYPGQVFSLPE